MLNTVCARVAGDASAGGVRRPRGAVTASASNGGGAGRRQTPRLARHGVSALCREPGPTCETFSVPKKMIK